MALDYLTPQQIAAFKADIVAKSQSGQPLQALVAGQDWQAVAAYYNAASATTIWKQSVTRDDLTVDGFDWTQVDNLTAGQARIWDLLFDNLSKSINPTEAGKRAAIAECWRGTAAKVAVATFCISKCKRLATRFEALFTADAAGTTRSLVVGQTVDGNDCLTTYFS